MAPHPAPTCSRNADQVDGYAYLQIADLTVKFGGIVALNGVSFQVPRGIVCGLIGPNGAGKTTCFNCISGLYRPASGDIVLNGKSLIGLPRHKIASRGVGRTFQNLALFSSMTVRQNVMVGAHTKGDSGFLDSILGLPSVHRSEARVSQLVDQMLRRFDLQDVGKAVVNTLPFAVLKRVELARAMASSPSLLILDEPAAGLNHQEISKLAQIIDGIRNQDAVTVLLVEHHMGLVMEVSDKVVVLDFGKKIAEGPPSQIKVDPLVVGAYLGSVAE